MRILPPAGVLLPAPLYRDRLQALSMGPVGSIPDRIRRVGGDDRVSGAGRPLYLTLRPPLLPRHTPVIPAVDRFRGRSSCGVAARRRFPLRDELRFITFHHISE